MGVLNCTPDSFSDGGLYLDERSAVEHAESMLRAGASIVDVGAESTRPGAARVSADDQLARMLGVVRRLSRGEIMVSVDTTDTVVAERVLGEGAALINCVDPSRAAPLAELCRRAGASLVIMHSRGDMEHMAGFSSTGETSYRDVLADVAAELALARDQALERGLDPADLLLDPGLGFHKSARHSLVLLAGLPRLRELGHELCVGTSRKSFLAAMGAPAGSRPAPPTERLGATVASCLIAAQRGAAVLRVHDVAAVRQALWFDRAARQEGEGRA